MSIETIKSLIRFVIGILYNRYLSGVSSLSYMMSEEPEKYFLGDVVGVIVVRS